MLPMASIALTDLRPCAVVRLWLLALLLLPAMASCASSPLGALRFRNRAPIVALDDRRPIPKPAEHEAGPITAGADALLRAEPMYVLSVPGSQPARDVNALDEVPDSTWFENRVGVRALSVAELARGPGSGGPDRSAPLRVLSSKQGGTAPGLMVEDARGDRYLIKFDPQWPETETGADVVVQRLLWAAGYNVPADDVIELARADLVIAPGATRKDELGEKHPLTSRDLDATLAAVAGGVRSRYRALASKLLDGEPIGGFAPLGVRADDANDRIPHQLRRSVRAQRVFFAWLGHTDVKPANTLDMWSAQPAGGQRGYVVHYLLDFGKALGVWGRSGVREFDGYAAQFDYGYALRSLLSFGLWRRPWEGVRGPDLPGVGRYEAKHFDPSLYSPANPYPPFLYADRFDGFWAARIIARFTHEQIRAAVDAARYSDPRARAYLVATIVARQRKTLRYWFAQVAPLDELSVSEVGGALQVCAADLAVRHGLVLAATTRYRVRSYDAEGRALGPAHAVQAVRGGALCSSGLPVSRAHDAYTMIALEVLRAGKPLPALIAHVARVPGGARPLRLIGIERR
jgi:hypothetical protein